MPCHVGFLDPIPMQWKGFPPTTLAILGYQLGVSEFRSVLALPRDSIRFQRWRAWSCKTAFPPSMWHVCHSLWAVTDMCFWLACYRFEVPTTHSLVSINLQQWLTEFREKLRFTSSLKYIINNVSHLSDEETHRRLIHRRINREVPILIFKSIFRNWIKTNISVKYIFGHLNNYIKYLIILSIFASIISVDSSL